MKLEEHRNIRQMATAFRKISWGFRNATPVTRIEKSKEIPNLSVRTDRTKEKGKNGMMNPGEKRKWHREKKGEVPKEIWLSVCERWPRRLAMCVGRSTSQDRLLFKPFSTRLDELHCFLKCWWAISLYLCIFQFQQSLNAKVLATMPTPGLRKINRVSMPAVTRESIGPLVAEQATVDKRRQSRRVGAFSLGKRSP